jgi:hypothetical protein
MLFWIFVILLIASIALTIWGASDYRDWDIAGGVLATTFGIVVGVMLILICVEHTNVDGYVAKKNAQREALVWQLENDIYDNDNDIGKYELMTEIREYNEYIVSAREAQDNFWIGIFFADIYDQLELIPLN